MATLAAVAETFVPGDAERRARLAVDALAAGTDPDDIARLRRALRLFEIPFVNLVLAGRPTRFADMSPADRERYLLGWATSRIKDRRVAFQALKRLLCFLAYADPGAGGTNPRLDRIGYVPDLDVLTHEPTTIRPELVTRTTAEGGAPSTVTLEADVVIVGSGAGGGVVACELAEAGRSVIVLEAGPFVAEPGMPTGELAAFDRLYLDHGTTSAVDTAVAILAGSCVGGGTVVNWTTCIAPPTGLREEWAREHGLDGFDGAVVDADIATLESELEVTAANPVGPKDAAILRGGAAAGIGDAAVIRRNADCGACGSCGFGCRRGTKASGLRVHLARAYSAGARIVADAEVERVIIEGGRAVGVTATVRPAAIGGTGGAGATRSAPGGAIDAAPAGHADAAAATGFRVVVRARQVVVAAGALRTPAVLERSGIGHPALGRNLRLHPVPVLGARFPEPVEMWRGVMQGARILVEPRPGDDQARYTIESASGHPGLLALAFPWEGSDAFASLMDGSRFFAPLLAICRDLDGGRVSLTRTGRVRIDYRISPRDAVTMRAALATMARVARGAGATELVALGTPARWLDLSGVGPAGGEAGIAPSGSEPAFAAYLAELARWDPAPGRGMVFSAHQMGTVRAGADAASHPCDPDGRVRAAGTGSGGVVAGACTSPTRRSSRRRLASTR
jgi:choline dehydrogenase-like flavoprotein